MTTLSRKSNLIALDALMKANIDARTKAQLFQQSVLPQHVSGNTPDLSFQASQTLADLKYALAVSLQHKPLFYS